MHEFDSNAAMRDFDCNAASASPFLFTGERAKEPGPQWPMATGDEAAGSGIATAGAGAGAGRGSFMCTVGLGVRLRLRLGLCLCYV